MIKMWIALTNFERHQYYSYELGSRVVKIFVAQFLNTVNKLFSLITSNHFKGYFAVCDEHKIWNWWFPRFPIPESFQRDISGYFSIMVLRCWNCNFHDHGDKLSNKPSDSFHYAFEKFLLQINRYKLFLIKFFI